MLFKHIALFLETYTSYRLVKVPAEFRRGDVVRWSGITGVVVSETGPVHAPLQAMFPGAQPRPLLVGFEKSGRMFAVKSAKPALELVYRPPTPEETTTYEPDHAASQSTETN